MPKTTGHVFSTNNIRSLVYFLGIQLDHRIAQSFKNTPYEKLRASDSRVFVAATRNLETISEIARHLQVSRQSAQSSVGRLVKSGLLKLDEHPASKREKLVVVTEQGHKASASAVAHLENIESELAALIGSEAYASLRSGLEKLVKSGFETRS